MALNQRVLGSSPSASTILYNMIKLFGHHTVKLGVDSVGQDFSRDHAEID